MRSFVFVRAINTGARRLSNDEQVQPLIDAGFNGVAAYQAAGNLVIDSRTAPDEAALDELLSAAYGFEVTTFVRSREEVDAAVAQQPFDDEQIARTAGRIQVTFLRSAPTTATIDDIDALVPTEDLVQVSGREWFWLPVDGVSGSSLPVPAIERLTGPMTMRTLGTLDRMLARFG